MSDTSNTASSPVYQSTIPSIFEELRKGLSETTTEYRLPPTLIQRVHEDSEGGNSGDNEAGHQGDKSDEGDEEEEEGVEEEGEEEEEGLVFEYPASEQGDEDDFFGMANGASFKDPPGREAYMELAEHFFYTDNQEEEKKRG